MEMWDGVGHQENVEGIEKVMTTLKTICETASILQHFKWDTDLAPKYMGNML